MNNIDDGIRKSISLHLVDEMTFEEIIKMPEPCQAVNRAIESNRSWKVQINHRNHHCSSPLAARIQT